MATKLTKEQLEFLNEKTCSLWPDCSCANRHRLIQNVVSTCFIRWGALSSVTQIGL